MSAATDGIKINDGEAKTEAGTECVQGGSSEEPGGRAECETSTKDGGGLVGIGEDPGASCQPAALPAPPTLTLPRIVPMATRSSTRPKRPRRDTSPPLSPPKKQAKVEPPPAKVATPETKTRRQWEQWSTLDKDTFFEALYEHGKDFEAIQASIAQKHKRKGEGTIVKTKEQIRHFYYRTWHKISKAFEGIEEITDVKSRHVAEMYGLVNYGELRRRIGGNFDEKTGAKLNEMIHKGSTVLRIKGKNQRIRTPLCKSLKKFNEVEENKDSGIKKIPPRVTVELRPCDNATWGKVQELAQNPRLRVTLNPSRRLSSLIDFLHKKWKPVRVQIKEGMQEKEEPNEEVKLRPLPGCKLRSFHIKQMPVPTNTGLCLDAYLENHKIIADSANSSPPTKRSRKESKSEQAKQAQEAAKAKEEVVKDSEVTQLLNINGSDLQCAKEVIPNILATVAKESKQAAQAVSAEKDKPSVMTEAQNGPKPGPSNAQNGELPPEERHENLEQYRAGWTRANGDKMTVGELYLLLGGPEKLILEYEWVELTPTSGQLIQLNEQLTNMLRRLVHIATNEFADFSKTKPAAMTNPSSPPQKCTCGAALKATPPNKGHNKSPRVSGSQVGKSPSTPKNSKPGGATTPRTPQSRQGAGTPTPAKLAPDQNGASNSSDDGVFRVPTHAPPRTQPQPVKICPTALAEKNSFLQQLESFNRQRPDIFLGPRRRRLTRNIRKPLVVQRTLLPKTQIPARQIMTLNLGQAGSFLPVTPNQLLPQGPQPIIGQQDSAQPITGQQDSAQQPIATQNTIEATVISNMKPISTSVITTGGTTTILGQLPVIKSTPLPTTDTMVTMVTAASPSTSTSMGVLMSSGTATTNSQDGPNISALLDISLPATSTDGNDTSTDRMIDLALGNSSASFSAFLDTDSKGADPNMASTVVSPKKNNPQFVTLGPENQWNNGEDFNLSNFIMDSPAKKPAESSNSLPPCETSRDSIRYDVDSAFQSMMNESSIDYIAKFADLAAQIGSQDNSNADQQPKPSTSHGYK